MHGLRGQSRKEEETRILKRLDERCLGIPDQSYLCDRGLTVGRSAVDEIHPREAERVLLVTLRLLPLPQRYRWSLARTLMASKQQQALPPVHPLNLIASSR